MAISNHDDDDDGADADADVGVDGVGDDNEDYAEFLNPDLAWDDDDAWNTMTQVLMNDDGDGDVEDDDDDHDDDDDGDDDHDGNEDHAGDDGDDSPLVLMMEVSMVKQQKALVVTMFLAIFMSSFLTRYPN